MNTSDQEFPAPNESMTLINTLDTELKTEFKAHT